MGCDKIYIRNVSVFILACFFVVILLMYTVNKYSVIDFDTMDRTFKNPKIRPDMKPSKLDHIVQEIKQSIVPVKKFLASSTPTCIDINNYMVGDKLSDFLFKYPWTKFEESIGNDCETSYRQTLIDGVQKYAFLEPLVNINSSCYPPALIDPKNIVCSDYPNAFLPNKYTEPVKVAHAIQLGFDADSLEIHLNEIYDVIDYFFILEATHVHCKILK